MVHVRAFTLLVTTILACLVHESDTTAQVSRERTVSDAPGSPQQQHSLSLPSRSGGPDECCHASGTPVASKFEKPKRMAFLIGAQKSGTSFLFELLKARHPKVRSQRKRAGKDQALPSNTGKEAHYFDVVPLPPLDRYLERFGDTTDSSATYLDATPDYLNTPAAACRIAYAFPDAKLVAVLRDPVSRALSQWNMIRQLRPTTIRSFANEIAWELQQLRATGCSFESAAAAAAAAAAKEQAAEEEAAAMPSAANLREHRSCNHSSSRGSSAGSSSSSSSWCRAAGLPSWNECFRCSFTRCGTYSGPANASHLSSRQLKRSCHEDDHPRAGVLRRGLYVYQLEWWLKFFPPEQLLVLNFEKLQQEPEAVLDQVIEFLGLDKQLKKAAGRASGFHVPHPGNTTAMYSQTLQDMYRFYAHANAELYQLLQSLGHASGWTGRFPVSPDEAFEKA